MTPAEIQYRIFFLLYLQITVIVFNISLKSILFVVWFGFSLVKLMCTHLKPIQLLNLQFYFY